MSAAAGTGLRVRDVARLGLAQVAVGAVAALMLSTLNRVMVVELRLLASVPSALVALHFVVQLARARMGFASDGAGARGRARWVAGGGVALGLGAALAAAGTAWAASSPRAGIAVCVLAYTLIGLGLSATGTALLATVAERSAPARLGGTAATLWILMIVGIVLSAGITGKLLDPFSPARLVAVGTGVGVAAAVLAAIAATSPAMRGGPTPARVSTQAAPAPSFAEAWRAAAREPATRRFAGFVFLAMLAFSAQDLILEPFAGAVFNLTVGESTRLGGLQNAAVLAGMILGGVLSARLGSLRGWAAGGCLGSAAAFVLLAQTPAIGSVAVLRVAVLALGFANGLFTVGGVGGMMALTASPDGRREHGLRLGLFGAVQAVAYGTGGLFGGVATDVARLALGSPAAGYAAVFTLEAVLFAGAALLALRSAPRGRLAAARVGERGADLVSVLS